MYMTIQMIDHRPPSPYMSAAANKQTRLRVCTNPGIDYKQKEQKDYDPKVERENETMLQTPRYASLVYMGLAKKLCHARNDIMPPSRFTLLAIPWKTDSNLRLLLR